MRKPTEIPRKSPRQSRSIALVEAIMEAAVRILPKVGNRAITTRQVAETAGVSVGSFYQYFPNKESLLGSLMDAALDSKMKEFEQKIDELSNGDFWTSIDRIVDFGVQDFLSEREKYREIFAPAQELGRVPLLMKIRRRTVALVAQTFLKYYPQVDEQTAVRMAFVSVNSLMGVIHIMLFDQEQKYSIEELQTELRTMMRAYVQSRLIELGLL